MIFGYDDFIHSTSSVSGLTNPFGIYVHIPFCTHKCSYCDFFSFTRFESKERDALVDRVAVELGQASQWLRAQGRFPQAARSLFFGGGTPSLLPMPLLQRVFTALQEAFPVAPDAEITLEANPETVSDGFCTELMRHTPVNRVSLGAQSFQADSLKKLERLGSRQSIIDAVGCLRRAGIESFSLDPIFGIPGQGREGMLQDLEEAFRLRPKHLSFYNLTLKPAHPLYSQLPQDDEAAELYEEGRQRIEREGYLQYEISNFAEPGFESRHNLLYWDGGDYLGVGPSAASRFFWKGRFHHRKQFADFAKYLSGQAFPEPDFEPTSLSQTVLEATFLELRKNRGVNVKEFRTKYGYDLSGARKYPLFLKGGLIEETGPVLRLTERGRLLADSVTRDLVDELRD